MSSCPRFLAVLSVKQATPSHSVLPDSMMPTGIIAAVFFVLAHFAMLIGVTTPEKFYFDEVHYVPAARQMPEQVMPQPMLNPMHPPLAKQFIARCRSTRSATGRWAGAIRASCSDR